MFRDLLIFLISTCKIFPTIGRGVGPGGSFPLPWYWFHREKTNKQDRQIPRMTKRAIGTIWTNDWKAYIPRVYKSCPKKHTAFGRWVGPLSLVHFDLYKQSCCLTLQHNSPFFKVWYWWLFFFLLFIHSYILTTAFPPSTPPNPHHHLFSPPNP